MKKKILFWVDDSSFLQYCFSTTIKNKTDFSFSTIADVNMNGRKFLENQNLLDISKVWFYRDCMPKKDHKPDEQYLIDFEKKYGINLWMIIFSERLFYNFTTYYKPTREEILSIVENSCKFFEKALDESDPNFLFIKTIDNFQNTILFELAQAKNIKILTLASAKLANSTHISLDSDVIDETKQDVAVSDLEIETFLKEHDPYKQDQIKKKKEFPTAKKRIANLLKYNQTQQDENYYPNYGKKSKKIILKNIQLTFSTLQRKKFLDKNSIKDIEDEHFVYFPLHVEPERSILITSPFYSDQIEVITNIAKSLPVGWKLYVKEHGSMELYFWRDQSFYKDIIKLQNVKLVHPSVNPKDILEKCDLVTTIAGTAGLEALFFEKPVITFSDIIYSKLPNVFRINDKNKIPETVRKALSLTPNKEGIRKLVSLYKKECLNIDMINLQHECMKEIGNSGINDLVNPTQEGLEKFINKNKKELEIIADEHIHKIELYEKNAITHGQRKDIMKI